MVKSPIEHKEPIAGSLDRPYRETDMSGASHYPWWAFCVLPQVLINKAQKNLCMNETKKCPQCKTDISKDAKKCPQCHADLRNWFVRHWILTILGVLIIISIIASASGSKKSTDVNSQAAPTNETAAKGTSTKTYQQIFTFSGNGAKKSEPFTITGDRFKIKYNCTGDLCQAFLHNVNKDYDLQVIMNGTGPLNDETIIYGSGEYYIDANTIGKYTMTVEDYR